jgi:hypothetical protein
MQILLDPTSEARALGNLLDGLVTDGLRAIEAGTSVERLMPRIAASIQTLGRLMAALAREAGAAVAAARRYQACRAALAGTPLVEGRWELDVRALEAQAAAELPALLARLAQLREVALPLLAGPQAPAPAVRPIGANPWMVPLRGANRPAVELRPAA